MALQLSTNLNHELMRLALAAQGLNSAEIEDLMPLDAADRPPPMPELAQLYPLQRPAAPQRRAQLPLSSTIVIGSGASNNWVVSGARTKSGKPLLANDPHLRLAAPSIWYLAHLALERPGASTANVVGATLPGMPLIVLGRSDTVAWGFTNTGADVQDLFIEKVNPDNPREYRTPDGWPPFAVEEMTIAVKGMDVRKVERRRTRHGPVLPGSIAISRACWRQPRGGAAVDRAQRRRHHHRRRHVRSRHAQRRRLHGAHAHVRGADAEHGGGRYERKNRHDRAGPRAGARSRQQGRRPRACARLGCDLRLEGLPRVRGIPRVDDPNVGCHRHRQRAHGRSRLSASPDLRLGCAFPAAAREGADLRPRQARHRHHARRPGRRAVACDCEIAAADDRRRPGRRLGGQRGARSAHDLGRDHACR